MKANDGHAEVRVAQHYATENLEQRILAAFEAAGKPRNSITADDLAAVDEFHIGGREATEAIAAQMDLRPGMRLLDIGSGIGGPPRHFPPRPRCPGNPPWLAPEYSRTAATHSVLVCATAPGHVEQGSAHQ